MATSWIIIIFWALSTHGCVLTDHEHTVQKGCDIYLSCNFSSCPWFQRHSASLEWEFNGSAVLIFHYANTSVKKWPNVEFVGNVTAGDFSIVLKSVSYMHGGTYLCRFRPLHSPFIYKNYTRLTIIHRRSGSEMSKSRSQENITKRGVQAPSPNTVPQPPWMLPVCYTVGLLVVVIAGGGLAWWLQWKSTVQRKEKGSTAPRGHPQPLHKNQDIYVTLQRCKHAPPPSPRKEGIYITMRSPGALDPAVQSDRSRKGIPLAWFNQGDCLDHS